MNVALRPLGWSLGLLLAVPALAVGCAADDDGAAVEQDSTSAACQGAKRDTAGRCRLPSGRFAKAACCEESACDAAFVDAIERCVDDARSDGELDFEAMEWELYAQCADVASLTPVRDEICSSNEKPFCALSTEQLATDYLPVCAQLSTDRWLDQSCVFGEVYRDLFGRAEAMVVLEQRKLTAADALSELREAQIVAATRESSYEVDTSAEAFEAVDQGEINLTELWDASGRRAFTAYEFGAGDNSYGAIFAHGTLTLAASIKDGDLYGCSTFWGPERRRCTADADCAGSSRCVGQSAASPLGRCVDTARDEHPALGQACGAEAGCPADAGLVCSSSEGAGQCQPAWQRGRFSARPSQPIPDNSSAGAEAQVLAYGLATVDTEVKLDLWISHERPSDLLITLENPSGTQVVVFDGATENVREIYFRGRRVSGFSGDESVNGVWRLRAVDRKKGQLGSIEELSLEISSRWD